MDGLHVRTKKSENVYPIYVERDYSNLTRAFEDAGLAGRRVCIVTDSIVAGLYLDEVLNIISDFSLSVCCHIFPAGEQSKTLQTIEGFYDCFASNKLERSSVVIALGGGVTGDMAGFAAASYMRGIPYVQLPTTLLSQVDSSVGGKTGVDYCGYKNLVGAFYQPRLVYINTGTLATLPREQFSSGMGEVLKHGLIADKDYYRYIELNADSISKLDEAALKHVVAGSCKIKARVVSEDEREQGLREILNFGHTFGHAVESVSGFSLSHGHCVGLGMLCAMYLSAKRGIIGIDDIERLKRLMEAFGMPTEAGINIGMVYEAMQMDKKNKTGTINLVLLEEIGRASHGNAAGKGEILEALRCAAKLEV